MKNWTDYKEHVKGIDPDSGRDITDMEEQANIISTVIKQRKELGNGILPNHPKSGDAFKNIATVRIEAADL